MLIYVLFFFLFDDDSVPSLKDYYDLKPTQRHVRRKTNLQMLADNKCPLSALGVVERAPPPGPPHCS